jgi:adenylate cyclase
MSHRFPVAVVSICLGVGLLGLIASLVPALSAAEEELGLHLLYRLRGPVRPPADVVIAAIDRESAQALKLPTAPHKWPRRLHARLLENLSARQASVVAFDLIFHEPQAGDDDQILAAAMRKAGNVILTQTIDRQSLPLADHNGVQAAQVTIDKFVSAIPLLADAAIGQAPFPLPRVPIKLSQYWRFSPGSAPAPTLPVAVLQAYAVEAFNGFLQLLRNVHPTSAAALPVDQQRGDPLRRRIEMIRPLYALFEKDSGLADRMDTALDRNPPHPLSLRTIKRIHSLIGVYAAGRSHYLNLYGPPGTIATISFHRLLADNGSGPSADLPSLKGKAVFVGQTESDWFKANDGFYTAFTQESGLDLSGVEIAATAFANLLEDKAVYPLCIPALFTVLIVWGVAATAICFQLSSPRGAVALLFLDSCYLGLAHIQFKTSGVWYPLITPILVQTPAAFIAALAWKYRKANAERRNIRKAFGYYLPDDVVARLAADIKELQAGGRVLYSICLFTDAEKYTTLSESLDPHSLTQMMNRYYEAIFEPIKAQKGLVLQVIGDSVLALWTAAEAKNSLKTAACLAAVEISEAVNRFNRQVHPYALPTRIGIHAGEILLGNIGAMDHFEYRPVGDIVNTASRLEGLNKFLGTRMLVSDEACGSDDRFMTRRVGRFVFKGKSRPVDVRELLPRGVNPPEMQAVTGRIFATGLEAFTRRDWGEAGKAFGQILKIDENDGPARFYIALCQQFRQTPPPDDWDGSVHLLEK